MIKPNTFKTGLAAKQTQLGLWCCIADAYTNEILAGSGYDWLTLDMEHSPNDARTVLAQIQMLNGHGVEPIVRFPKFDGDVVKLHLDMGVRTLLFPNVETADQAKAIVSATRYPPRGIRGVAGLQRANQWGRVKNYHANAEHELCVVAQIESLAAVKNIAQIAAVDGIDGLFVGPSDLAASMGFMGNPLDPVVQQAILDAKNAILSSGKWAGILARGVADAEVYATMGFTMIGLGSDQGLLAKASDDLVTQFRAKTSA
jgi:2-keto-3-deoxy-L-rhamnonate aldolase RhmA